MVLQSYKSFGGILETIIVIAFMTYIVDLNTCELHPGDEKVFIDFINGC